MSDHHHTHPVAVFTPEQQAAIQQTIVGALSHPGMVTAIVAEVSAQVGNSLNANAERMIKINASDALVKFEKYNDAGDTCMLMTRRLNYNPQALTLIVTYSVDPTNPEGICFDIIAYRDDQNSTFSTAFIAFDDDVRSELNRQISELYTPDKLGRSIQVTMLALPKFFAQPQA